MKKQTTAVQAMENLNHLIKEGYPIQDKSGQAVDHFTVSEDQQVLIPIFKSKKLNTTKSVA